MCIIDITEDQIYHYPNYKSIIIKYGDNYIHIYSISHKCVSLDNSKGLYSYYLATSLQLFDNLPYGLK